ncbi:MAG: CHRD domain-containing protein [Gaiellaceae bacterium]|jgi:hypothetical protein
MKKIVVLLVAFAALTGAAIAFAGFNQNFGTHLRGRTENPPRATQAQGQALFHLSDDGLSMEYKLIVANIDNAFMAHIHIGPAGVNGPIAVWLYPSTTPGLTAPLGQGRLDGVIAQGVFTAANFTGPLSGHSMADLVSHIMDGTAYVNVHTNDGVDGTNTGPGDFPGGEIRAQLVD